MLKLIQTEFLKLRRRKFVWLMLLAALFMPFLALFYFRSMGETGIDPVQFYKWDGVQLYAVDHFACCFGAALHDAHV